MISEHSLPAGKLAKGDSLTIADSRAVYYGTAEVSFTLRGEAILNVCGRTFALSAPEATAYRAPVIAYNCAASVTLRALGDAEVRGLRLRVGEHLPVQW